MTIRLWIAAVSSTLLALTAPAFGACLPAACIGEKITQLYISTDGSVYIQTTGDMSQLNCTLASGVSMTLDMSLPGSEAIYALLLSLRLTDQPLGQIRIVDGSNGCDVMYVWQ